MAFRVIEGGLSARSSAFAGTTGDAPPTQEDVLREAERRIRAIGYDRWRNREAVTGIPVPREIRYLAMQIGYVAEAIGRLADIPADFHSDVYWPA
ncbi:hypothetical protein J2046_006277 [Rhizobium petrolearium]|uniref:hypothetical protein n=1 Tax=Neorhizobium petrolearium TaxID=515361 RepID=UPI001AEB66B7|nr:hypothetical protein [Neorhizobium petrolearium]MBP1847992.1 hypothetical protein [Neorhizobium petrolearium]